MLIQKNLHQMKSMKKNAMPPTGAHFRNSACRLMFRAALRYLTDSARNEVERCDIPGRKVVSVETLDSAFQAHDLSYLLAIVDPPCSSS